MRGVSRITRVSRRGRVSAANTRPREMTSFVQVEGGLDVGVRRQQAEGLADFHSVTSIVNESPVGSPRPAANLSSALANAAMSKLWYSTTSVKPISGNVFATNLASLDGAFRTVWCA